MADLHGVVLSKSEREHVANEAMTAGFSTLDAEVYPKTVARVLQYLLETIDRQGEKIERLEEKLSYTMGFLNIDTDD